MLKEPRATGPQVILARLLLATNIVISIGLTTHAIYILRLAERITISDIETHPASDEKLLAMLRSQGMSPATYRAALDMAERSVELRKLAVGMAVANTQAQLVGGAAVFLLSITTMIVLRKTRRERETS